MSQTNYNAKQEEIKIWLPCPNCKTTTRYSVGIIENAIETTTQLFCVACGEMFRVKVEGQTRVTEQRNAAVQPAIELLRIILKTGVLRNPECPSWVSARVAAVLKAAGGG